MDNATTNAGVSEAMVERAASEAFIRIAEQLVEEQRKARRWGNVFKLSLLVYGLLLILVPILANLDAIRANLSPHAGLVKVKGIIDSDHGASASRIIKGLLAAFENPHSTMVILEINSPGGSPVQAQEIVSAIHRFREEHPHKKLVAAIGDMGASAAYYIASAADEIIASPASVVGSIGVRMDSFGLVEAMRRIGVERRLYTAGEHKGLLDMFREVRPEEEQFIRQTLARVHRQFIEAVKAGRGEKLADDLKLFSGLFWTGEEAKELGLVDEVVDRREYMSRHGLDVAIDYTPSLDWSQQLGRITGMMAGLLSMLTRPLAVY